MKTTRAIKEYVAKQPARGSYRSGVHPRVAIQFNRAMFLEIQKRAAAAGAPFSVIVRELLDKALQP
jgi:hypothetical protein